MSPSQAPRCFGAHCQPGACGGIHGWTADYAWIGNKCLPLVELSITYRSWGVIYSEFASFVVDSGAEITVVPRIGHLRGAFRRPAEKPLIVADFVRHPIAGSSFSARLSLSPRHRACKPLIFPQMDVFVAGDESIEYGLLGFDALRQIITIFDQSAVTFHQPPTTQGA